MTGGEPTPAPAEIPPALEIRGASKHFGRTRALVDVDLVVQPGSVCALVGANGSGKSTLIKALAGYHQLDEGAIAVHGTTLSGERLGEQGRDAGLRFVHQDLALIPSLSVADNLGFARGYTRDRLGTIRWRRERARSRAELRAVGIDVDPSANVSSLGPVERTLLAIARAMDQVDPTRNVLLLDEPTARLPQHEAGRLIARLRMLRDRGLPVVYVSHRLEEIYDLADRITVLRDGVEAYAGPVGSLPIDELRVLITGLEVSRRAEPRALPAGATTLGGAVLELKHVSARTVQDISLTIHAGEVVGITGLVGSGRSELGRVVYGLQRYVSGEIEFDGKPAGYPRSRAVDTHRVGYTPQERRDGMLSRLTVGENLTIASFQGLVDWYGLSRSRLRHAADELIELLRIKPADATRVIDVLSGGNQQKVGLGRWLRLPLRLIVLDEPTQSIDIGAKADLMEAIRQRARVDGLAVLWLESDVEELVKYADRVIVMRSGEVVAEFGERPFSTPAILAACYGAGMPRSSDERIAPAWN
jgi:ribose transport system ATP-binding protein